MTTARQDGSDPVGKLRSSGKLYRTENRPLEDSFSRNYLIGIELSRAAFVRKDTRTPGTQGLPPSVYFITSWEKRAVVATGGKTVPNNEEPEMRGEVDGGMSSRLTVQMTDYVFVRRHGLSIPQLLYVH